MRDSIIRTLEQMVRDGRTCATAAYYGTTKQVQGEWYGAYHPAYLMSELVPPVITAAREFDAHYQYRRSVNAA